MGLKKNIMSTKKHFSELLVQIGFNVSFSSDPQEPNPSLKYEKDGLIIHQPEENKEEFIIDHPDLEEMIEMKYVEAPARTDSTDPSILETFFNNVRSQGATIDLTEMEVEDLIDTVRRFDQHQQNVGLFQNRTETCPREKAFHDEWLKMNRPEKGINRGNGIIQDLVLNYHYYDKNHIIWLNEQERQLIATAIQWLGSNIGTGFLDTCLRKFGKKIANTEENNPQFEKALQLLQDSAKFTEFTTVDFMTASQQKEFNETTGAIKRFLEYHQKHNGKS